MHMEGGEGWLASGIIINYKSTSPESKLTIIIIIFLYIPHFYEIIMRHIIIDLNQ